jgi:hypothetical protein
LNSFPENSGPISDENDGSFHEDISQIEKRHSGKWSPNMLSDYCCGTKRETITRENKRQKKTMCVLMKLFLVRIP